MTSNKAVHRRTGCLALGAVALFGNPISAPAQEPAKTGQARLRIECFAPSRAYAVGQGSITLIAVVRNVGDAPLAEGSVSGRMTCVSGLDYGDGDTLPKLPALIPNAVVNYRWRVTPSTNSGALVAAFALEYPNGLPDVRVTGIQHLASEPNEGTPSPISSPVARAHEDRGVLENGRVRARIETSAANVPGLWLSTKSSTGWRRAGVSLPIAEVMSGEGGQEPWWEVFRAEDIRAVNGIKEASLILTGGVGIRWRATLVFTLRADTSVLDYDIRLAPLRPIKISGLRLGTFLAGDGGFGSGVTEELPYAVNGGNAVAAVRSQDTTVGCSWPTKPLFRDWQMQPLPNIPGADYQLLGAELRTPSAAVELRPGALVDYHGRVYALTSTTNVRNAFNITVPAQRSEARPVPMAVRMAASRHASARYSTSRRALIIRRDGKSHRGRALAPAKRGKRARASMLAAAKRSARARGKHGKAAHAVRSRSGGGHRAKSGVSKRSVGRRSAGAHRSRWR